MTLHYDVVADFEPVALISATPWLIAAKKDLPVNDLSGLIAWLKANPDKASLGTAGVGSPSHIARHAVPERHRHALSAHALSRHRAGDPGPGLRADRHVDPRSGHLLPQFRAGRIKVFAVMAKSRTANAPDIPTVDEAGAPGLHIAPWQAIWAPKGTPKDVIAKLNGAVVEALADPAVRAEARRAELRGRPRARSRRRNISRAFHKAEIEKWWPIIKAAGIKGG